MYRRSPAMRSALVALSVWVLLAPGGPGQVRAARADTGPQSGNAGASGSSTKKVAPTVSGRASTSATSSGNGKGSKSGTAGSTKGGTGKGGRGTPDPVSRRQIAGGPTIDEATAGFDTPELKALREAERELFPPSGPAPGSAWPTELGSPLSATETRPLVHASGLPPRPPPSSPPLAEGGHDLSWLAKLELPDLPVRWDARVVRFLEFFKDDPRGRAVLATWTRRSGRYRDAIRRTLRKKGVPEDLLWLSMIESGFDPTARSVVGAMGLWQFMPETAKAYGMGIDRWADDRLNPVAATEGAADFLNDLYRRFGSWELAIAAYNMGYWGVVGSIRKYNSNDFWTLSRFEGALPWETTLYVPKVIAAAIIGRNPAVFGVQDLVVEPALDGDQVDVPPGTALSVVAQAAGCTTKELEQLNPELRASRTPPSQSDKPASDYPVRVPAGRAQTAGQNLAKARRDAPPTERYVMRFGESLEQVAAARRVSLSKLVELNGIGAGEVVRGGTVLIVPRMVPGAASPVSATSTTGKGAVPSASASATPTNVSAVSDGKAMIAVVPADVFVYPDRRRVFYRVLVGDTVREIADTFHVTTDELRRWNDLDPSARLQEGMTLQLFVPEGADLTGTVVLGENDVRVLPVGSEEFFAYWESLKGRRRITVTAKDGDTLGSIGGHFGMSGGMMERINRRSRGEKLAAGDSVIVYVPEARAGAGDPVIDPFAPQPNGPLPEAPAPDALPTLR